MPKISPLAVVDPKAQIAEDVEIGPFCVVGPQVAIGNGCRLMNHVTISGITTLGKDNVIHPGACLGGTPQDRKYQGARTRLEIGDGNMIREGVTIHVGTEKGGGLTRVGNDNFMMVNVHLGHDIHLGSHCMLANHVMMGGHCIVGDYANIMASAGFNHKVTIGEYTFVAAFAHISCDVPPFCRIDEHGEVRALNAIGLHRGGIGEENVAELDKAYRVLFGRKASVTAGLARLAELDGHNVYVKRLTDFLRARGASRHGRALEGFAGAVA